MKSLELFYLPPTSPLYTFAFFPTTLFINKKNNSGGIKDFPNCFSGTARYT